MFGGRQKISVPKFIFCDIYFSQTTKRRNLSAAKLIDDELEELFVTLDKLFFHSVAVKMGLTARLSSISTFLQRRTFPTNLFTNNKIITERNKLFIIIVFAFDSFGRLCRAKLSTRIFPSLQRFLVTNICSIGASLPV